MGAQFLKVALAHLLALASPGPDFAMVMRQSLAHGRRTAIWTSVGIGSAILVHVTYSLLGIGLLLRESPIAFAVLKYAGAAYLAWIGLKALGVGQIWGGRSVSAGAGGTGGAGGAEFAAARADAVPSERANHPTASGPRASWVAGFLTNVLNPKATLFIVALFAAVIDPSTPRWIQACYGLWMSVTTLLWFSAVSLLFTKESVRRNFLRAGPWIDRTMGLVLIGFAVALALAKLG